MPVRELDAALHRRQATRSLIFGPPNSFKTTSLLTFPFPLIVISPPGEEGYATIPVGVDGLKAFIWEEPPTDPVSASSMRTEVEGTVYRAIAGEFGPVRTLAVDGFHNMYDIYLNIATGGSYGRGEEFDPRCYGPAHQMARTFLRRVLSSPVEYIAFTCWNAKEADKPGEKGGDAHQFPMLPGMMAKHIVGRFPLTIFSKVQYPRTPTEQPQGYWQLKPDNEVWGAMVKTDPRVIAKIPSKVPQNWKKLEPLIVAALDESEQTEEVV